MRNRTDAEVEEMETALDLERDDQERKDAMPVSQSDAKPEADAASPTRTGQP
jgi:hypothetical protein